MSALINLAYLVAASLFIVGLKRLSSPATARRGNQLAAVGMLIAVVATLLTGRIISPGLLVAGLALGAALGALLALKVKMTAMPEMVAALNGFGGGASVLVASAEVARYTMGEGGIGAASLHDLSPTFIVTALLTVLIGAVTFSGSFVAFAKLGEYVSGKPVNFPGMRALTVLLALAILALAAWPLLDWANPATLQATPLVWAIVGITVLALILGVLLVIPIGGADMPVVVALLNSYSGLAAAASGFVLANYALIVSGALVGASGLILTRIMCEAMNRSMANVLLGGFGGDGGEVVAAGGDGQAVARPYRQTSAEDAAVLLGYAQKVAIVPGYGLAVAQAQHQARELADVLQARGVEVKYAIHPVAGRMPGHMNVLLAEANVPYDQLVEMDEINSDLESTDVALIIGANDVVNPAARTDKSSPIYGMPIIDVDHAKNVIVIKRSMRAGYAGVDNDLFYLPNTMMLFGDAKQALQSLIHEAKTV